MFLLTKRISAGLPLAWLLIGVLQTPWLIPAPALAMLAFLLWRHRHILTLVGSAPLASDGFAKHVMVDDLLRLGGQHNHVAGPRQADVIGEHAGPRHGFLKPSQRGRHRVGSQQLLRRDQSGLGEPCCQCSRHLSRANEADRLLNHVVDKRLRRKPPREVARRVLAPLLGIASL